MCFNKLTTITAICWLLDFWIHVLHTYWFIARWHDWRVEILSFLKKKKRGIFRVEIEENENDYKIEISNDRICPSRNWILSRWIFQMSNHNRRIIGSLQFRCDCLTDDKTEKWKRKNVDFSLVASLPHFAFFSVCFTQLMFHFFIIIISLVFFYLNFFLRFTYFCFRTKENWAQTQNYSNEKFESENGTFLVLNSLFVTCFSFRLMFLLEFFSLLYFCRELNDSRWCDCCFATVIV